MSGDDAVPAGVLKLCGADVELGNYVVGTTHPLGSGREAARALLEGVSGAQDGGRHYLATNGGSIYIDLDHLELCLPEVRSAFDHVAAWHAMLRLSQTALHRVNAGRPHDRPIRALVNNSDGHGNSYGGHLNVLVTRHAWRDLMERRLHYLAFLVAHQASSLVLTGQGKVGSENGAPDARYQLSQRADFLETLVAPQTTFRRPLVNTRDEPLTGNPWEALADPGHPAAALARLHVICYDSTLCHAASLLKVGSLQIVLAMLEAGAAPLLALDDPLSALRDWSRDPLLETRALLVDGRRVTAVEMQQLIHEHAGQFAARGGCEGIVPRAGEILALWSDTLIKCRDRDWAVLARRLDWVLKLGMLERAMHCDPSVDWNSPRLKVLDHLYSSLDPGEGLYWAWARAGGVEEMVPEEHIMRLMREPPEDTRAWTRAMLLRRAGPDQVEHVDWDHIRFRLRGGRRRRLWLAMPDPLGWTRARIEPQFARYERLDELITALGGERIKPAPRKKATHGRA